MFGTAAVLSLLVTAVAGLWLDLVYHTEATTAWTDIDELQAQIERGVVVSELRLLAGQIAVATTIVWLIAAVASRARVAFGVMVVAVLSLGGWWIARGPAPSLRWVLECSAVVGAALTLAVWFASSASRPRPDTTARSDRGPVVVGGFSSRSVPER